MHRVWLCKCRPAVVQLGGCSPWESSRAEETPRSSGGSRETSALDHSGDKTPAVGKLCWGGTAANLRQNSVRGLRRCLKERRGGAGWWVSCAGRSRLQVSHLVLVHYRSRVRWGRE